MTRLTLAATLAVALAAVSARADVLVTSGNTGAVLQYNQSTGAFINAFVTPNSGGLANPSGLATGPTSHVFVADVAGPNAAVFRYTPGGAPAPATGLSGAAFVPVGSGGLTFPNDVVVRPNNNLLVSGAGSNNVVQYNGTTGAALGTFVTAGSGGLTAPTALLFAPGLGGDLLVASNGTNNIIRYNGTTGALVGPFASGGGLSAPTSMTFGPDGNLYVASANTDSVIRYNGATGVLLGVFVAPGSGGLNGPAGLTFGPDGNLYVTSELTNSVLRYSGFSGAFLNVFIAANSGGLTAPRDILFTPVPIPEPSSAALAGLGIAAAGVIWRRRVAVKGAVA